MENIISKLNEIGKKSNEGALFFNPNPMGIEEQTRFIELLIKKYKVKNIVEIGTNKGFFVLFVVSVLDKNELIGNIHTFDLTDFSESCIQEIKNNYPKHSIVFKWGDSKETFSNFIPTTQIDLTFVDGGHDYKNASSDIKNAIRIGSSLILIDDYDPNCQHCEVKRAVDDSELHKMYDYIDHTNKIDDRGMGLFKKK